MSKLFFTETLKTPKIGYWMLQFNTLMGELMKFKLTYKGGKEVITEDIRGIAHNEDLMFIEQISDWSIYLSFIICFAFAFALFLIAMGY